MKVKGKDVVNNSNEIIGYISGHRTAGYNDCGYTVKLNSGFQCGPFAYFQDAAKYVRNGGLSRDAGVSE